MARPRLAPLANWLCVLALLSGAASGASAIERERTLAEYLHTGWTVEDGAPGQVAALAQTRDGFLWLATQVGLFRFDGVQFERYEPPPSVTLPSENVSAMFAPAAGGLWIGYRYGGASFLDAGRVVSYTEADGFSTGSVFGFAQDRDGTLWAATYQGLMRKAGPRWEWVRGEWGLNSRPARAVLVDRDGTLWVAGKDTLSALVPGARKFRVAATGIGQVSQIAQAPDGTIWIAETAGAVRAVSPGAAPDASPPPAALAMPAAGIGFDRDGTLWISGAGGGVRRHPQPGRLLAASGDPAVEASHAFSQANGLTADFVGPVLEDREGNIWFGTARGLDRFRPARFVPAGLPDGSIDFALVAGDDGTIWVGTRNRPLMRIQVRRLTATALDQPISCAYRDGTGRIWLGGAGGIWRLEDGEPVYVTALPDRATGSSVQAMTVDRQGALWVSLNVPGVFRYERGRWTHLLRHPGLLERSTPLTLLTDAQGRIWLGYSRNRITLVDGERMRLIGAADGLDVGNVTALVRGATRTWIGGERGLAHSDGSTFQALVAIDERVLKGISGLVERADGALWLNGSRGVVHVPAAEVRKAIADPAHRVSTELFDFLDGLPGAPAQFRPLPTAIEGDDGRLWFATTSGVVWLDPANIARNPLPPPVVIRSIQSGDRVHQPTSPLNLPPRTGSVQIRYAATSLSIPERVRFRYRLDGLDEDWHEAGSRREASFNSLGPGAYRFHVVAANEDGVWSTEGAVLDFTVEPTFVQSGWFRALCAVAAFGVLWVLYLARLRQLGARIRTRLEERHLERERIARELHDTLLQSIQGLVLRFQAAADAVAAGPARTVLESALDRADAVLAEGRDRVNDLRASAAGIDDLPEALGELGRELAAEHDCRFGIAVAGDPRVLSPLVRDEAYRIGREALINAFRHAHASLVDIEIDWGPRGFRLQVHDDGQGIDPEILDAGGRAGHWGLTGMKERALRVGGTFEVSSRKGAGTRLELHVPASAAYGEGDPDSRWRRYWHRLGSSLGLRSGRSP